MALVYGALRSVNRTRALGHHILWSRESLFDVGILGDEFLFALLDRHYMLISLSYNHHNFITFKITQTS